MTNGKVLKEQRKRKKEEKETLVVTDTENKLIPNPYGHFHFQLIQCPGQPPFLLLVSLYFISCQKAREDWVTP